MAAATATPTVNYTEATQNMLRVHGTVAISASPATYGAGGVVMSFAGLDRIKSDSVPISVRVFSKQAAGSGAAALFVYNFNPGTTLANGKLQVFTGAAAQSGLAELSDGAVPAGVSGDVIGFEAVFPRL